MARSPCVSLSLLSWNVQGLGDPDKCTRVRDAIASINPYIVCIQETKLSSLDAFKLATFLPGLLSAYVVKDAEGSRGGIVTAWNPRAFDLVSSSFSLFTLTTVLSSTVSDLVLLSPMSMPPLTTRALASSSSMPMRWPPQSSSLGAILGDFNLIRRVHEKNKPPFDAARAATFNSLINDLAWFELPLSDRLYTWTNRRSPPTLERLDRVFFDAGWDALLPDSALSSRARTCSDHVPLVVSASTKIPAALRFFFENAWLADPRFLAATLPSWTGARCSRDAAGDLASRKKAFRSVAKTWKRQHRFFPTFKNDCVFLIDLFDFLEESRCLSADENALRSDARCALEAFVLRQAAFWKQRGKCRRVREGDENTRFFHAQAFRPVSLQNADGKTLCRGLTSRLQWQISPTIDEDQSGFIPGRSIAENFIYALVDGAPPGVAVRG
ncbi:uncharacterized protein [Aegilops tauschii subsp. strangulata]|uniref:uncharacterized protein n=1 Tax=Aegilops tauschii subsp. strangulata TaxID=200361 RepID=UPI003CC8E1CD